MVWHPRHLPWLWGARAYSPWSGMDILYLQAKARAEVLENLLRSRLVSSEIRSEMDYNYTAEADVHRCLSYVPWLGRTCRR